MDTKSEKKKRWLDADKVKMEDGLQCACSGCEASILAIMDGPDDPGVICFEHYVNGEPCIGVDCNRPQVDKGLCRQCLMNEYLPPKMMLYRESMISRCAEYGNDEDDVSLKVFNKLISKALKKHKIELNKYNPFNVHQV